MFVGPLYTWQSTKPPHNNKVSPPKDMKRSGLGLVMLAIAALASLALAVGLDGAERFPSDDFGLQHKSFIAQSISASASKGLYARALGPRKRIADANSEGDCAPGYPSQKGDLETCCWYNARTCCNPQIAKQILPFIIGNLTQIHEDIGVSDSCYYGLADLMCLSCSPGTADWIKSETNGIKLHICLSLCDKLFQACKDDLAKLPGLEATATNGKELCTDAFNVEDPNSIVMIEDNNKGCFAGVSLATVEDAHCLPGDSDGDDDDDGDEEEADKHANAAKVGLFVMIPLLVLTCIALAAALGYIYVLRKEMKRYSSVGDADGDFTIGLDALEGSD